MIRVHNPKLFDKEVIKTEYTAYKIASESASYVYAAVPWSVMLNHGPMTTPKFKADYTVCQHIRYKEIIPHLVKMGIKVLFTPHVDRDDKRIKILPFPHVAVMGALPAVTKDIFCAFTGAETHPCRAVIFKTKKPPSVVIEKRKAWHFELPKADQKKFSKRYKDLLARSRYSLCPRGTGPSTIRFWESLQAGSVPVLIGDDMRLPPYDWGNCIIRVKEKNTKDVYKTIQKYADREDEMRKNCLKAYAQFSGQNFISCIDDYHNRNKRS